jgi:uncharacterized membrane protein
MAQIVDTVEIDRPPDEVFAYMDQLERHGEWQADIQSVRVETEGPTRVGTRATDRRKTPMGSMETTYEITEHDPPRKAAFRGVNGPVRPVGSVTVEPLDGGTRSRVTLSMDMVGHGIGKLLAPMARMQARKDVPKAQRKMKEILESGRS